MACVKKTAIYCNVLTSTADCCSASNRYTSACIGRLAHTAMDHVQVALIAGVIYTAVGILNLGWVTQFLSHSVIGGFMSGASLIIGLSQVCRSGLSLVTFVPTLMYASQQACSQAGLQGTVALGRDACCINNLHETALSAIAPPAQLVRSHCFCPAGKFSNRQYKARLCPAVPCCTSFACGLSRTDHLLHPATASQS